MTYKHIEVPQDGKKIFYKDGQIQVSDHPIVGLIEGDGIGTDITPVMLR